MTIQICQPKKTILPLTKSEEKMPSGNENITRIMPTPKENGNEMNIKSNINLQKTCSKCGIEKSIYFFYKDKRGKYGRRADCSECNNKSRKIWQKINLDKVLLKNKIWRESNKEHVEEWKKQYAPRRRTSRNNRYKSDKNFRDNHIENVRHYRNNPKNKEKIRELKTRIRKKHSQNPKWRLIQNLRRRFLFVLHGKRKADHTLKMIGCSRAAFLEYLESQFAPGMNWKNYGRQGWHIDHITPCDAFDLSIPEEQKKCFHYTNLRPLWWYENLKKGNQTFPLTFGSKTI